MTMDSTADDQKDIAKDQLNGELYKALLNEDEEKMMELCERIDDHAFHILTIHNDTVLHKATYSKQANLVLRLLEALPPHHLSKITCQNDCGNTILHEAATLRHQENSVGVARRMLQKAPELLSIRNNLGETPLFRAARYGKTEIFDFLAEEISEYNEASQQPFIQRDDKTTILHIAILSQHFGLALKIAERFGHIIDKRDEDGMTALQLLSCNPSAFKNVHRRGLFKRIFTFVEMYCSWSGGNNDVRPREKLSNESALELAKLLVKKDTSWKLTSSAIESNTKPYGSSNSEKEGNIRQGLLSSMSLNQEVEERGITPLFLATKSGCIEIVKEILEIYPQAVEHIDNEGRTVLHVAIKYRQLEVFELVLKMEVAMRWLVRRIDNKGDSILHMVGVKREDYVPEKLRGPAFELQEELLWFARVKSVTKAHFIDHRNNLKQTAECLFASTYKDLRHDAKAWLKRTAEGCSIVAVLISTVAFTAAYTIPGGSEDQTGFPNLRHHRFFVVFTAADVLSILCALTSVVILLSVLTSPYRLDDFRHKLPNKVMLGVTFLFLSVCMMMIAFAATIVLVIRSKESWTKAVLYSLTLLPVGIFAVLYLPLYVSLTKNYKYLFKKIAQASPWIKWFPGLSHSSNHPRAQLTHSKHKSEKEDFHSWAVPQTSNFSV
ncbi:ankyrin repeat-containing protein ITN1-like [Corylus avellana]|uniref:ankyrin repeat-containing protein ITN1-like n=1 Tax=Corylus avellana TaxID=13451 RepID=UPI001E21EB77|nr:ankyrin repeat-containing protein ITN1-like [Corylus avellana]